MKTTTKILIVLALILGLCGYMTADVYIFAPKRISTRYEELSSADIPEQLNGMNILYFSDLDYGTFVNEERLNALVDKINALSPDVILFGGDLYDDAASFSDNDSSILSKAFSSLKASYGKYAVYGNSDDRSDEMKAAVNSIYAASDFEVLNNQSISLHKQSSGSITLVGLDSSVNGKPDIDAAYSTVSRDSYVITICHTPDTALSVPADITNYFLAGHSHGGQAYYFFGALYEPEGAKEYLRGTHTVSNSFTLDITNGVGTTKKDVRFLADAEVVMYQLKHTESASSSSASTPSSADASAS
jgi:predicted MPP superfamily phosphohydrolase